MAALFQDMTVWVIGAAGLTVALCTLIWVWAEWPRNTNPKRTKDN